MVEVETVVLVKFPIPPTKTLPPRPRPPPITTAPDVMLVLAVVSVNGTLPTVLVTLPARKKLPPIVPFPPTLMSVFDSETASDNDRAGRRTGAGGRVRESSQTTDEIFDSYTETAAIATDPVVIEVLLVVFEKATVPVTAKFPCTVAFEPIHTLLETV